jgi:carbamoylphosphate synthase large subunit
MRNKPLHILITSAGSLVAHNILEGLAAQRQHYRVTGINCLAGAVSNFLCDRVYLVPPLDDAEAFAQRFNAIVEQERPDLIIPGRDDDMVYLSTRSDLPVMTGPAALAAQLRDKWQSCRFAQRHGLPFAETLRTEDGLAALLALSERAGWPLVAKPSAGQASRGVVLVGDAGQLAVAATWPGYCFQPWLGHVPEVASLMQAMRGGLPLGWSLPQSKTSMDGWITPAGEVGGLFCTLHEEVVLGRSERVSRIDTPHEHGLLRAYADALQQEGWRGPFNIQLAPDAKSNLQAFEINGRFTGSAATLTHLGLDFVQGAIAAFTGMAVPAPSGAVKRVDKRLANWSVPDQGPDQLERDGYWSRQVLPAP